jgi:hypothetical protein
MQANERTNQLRADLSTFKASVKRDSTRIKADLRRLLVIYKNLNDVVILTKTLLTSRKFPNRCYNRVSCFSTAP